MSGEPTRTGTVSLEDLLVKTSRTFALSIPVLPEPTRREVTVAYLLFRIADTLEDATDWTPERKLTELDRLASLLRQPRDPDARGLAEDWLRQPPLSHEGYLELLSELPTVLDAFRELTPAARDLVRDHTLRTIEAMTTFVSRTGDAPELQLDDISDLLAYCYAVAGIVGEMLTELFLLGSPNLQPIAAFLRTHAARFGEALQLVNILKDSATDADEGRRYLPEGVDRTDVFLLARASLEAAGGYVRRLQDVDAPRGFVAFTALPVLLAWSTLERVEERGPGSKLTRAEVQEISLRLEAALDRGSPAVPSEG